MALCGLGVGQLALAQTQANRMAAANPAPRVESQTSSATHATAAPASSVTTPAAMAAMVPVAPAYTIAEKAKAKNKNAGDENDKNPYWEPRDWTYIENQGP
jgi:hypothetical protein